MQIALKEFAGLTNRAIAELCGVSDMFVGKIRPELLQTVCNTPEPEKRTGTDGRQYNAHKPPRATPKAEKQTAIEEEEAEYLQKALAFPAARVYSFPVPE